MIELNETAEDRFWGKVDRGSPDDCWPWLASTNHAGYGQIRPGGRGSGMVAAHRLSYQLEHGPFDTSLCVLHHCDNPPCVNPAHLWLGEQADNLADMREKERANPGRPKGEQNGSAKLTVDEVRQIRGEDGSLSEIAEQYDMSKTQIGYIRRGESWQHV